MNMRKLSRPKLQICKQNKHLEISRNMYNSTML